MPRTISLFFLTIFFVGFSNCSQKIDPQGTFQASPVVADGALNEWSLPLRFGNKAGTIQYSITNDQENVYVAMLSKDEATEEKILRMGMTLYFDPSGGDGKTVSISYPERSPGGQGEESRQHAAGGAAANQRSKKQEMLLQASEFTVAGFQYLENRSYEVNEKNAIQLSLKINDNNELAYEAVVPIKNILGHPLTANDPKKNFSVGFVVKGFSTSGQTAASPGMRGDGGGRGGMGGGRGMGGRGNMGGSRAAMSTGNPDRSALLKDDANWYKFRLADK